MSLAEKIKENIKDLFRIDTVSFTGPYLEIRVWLDETREITRNKIEEIEKRISNMGLSYKFDSVQVELMTPNRVIIFFKQT